MQPRWISRSCVIRLRIASRGARYYSPKPSLHQSQQLETQKQLAKTRNIGIIAHIDAGKTTTTERMLYYSGFTRRIGDVDDGSTVTDFLPAERARGITIQSAAITFLWPPKPAEGAPGSANNVPTSSSPLQSVNHAVTTDPHTINLIDTPGHADFTFEVVRSLRVLDGAICILDGVAGVEAQTEKVWTQASKHRIPRLIFVNKLDRDGAAFQRTVHEIAARLHTWPLLCQIPWWRQGVFVGVADVIGLRGLLWEGGDGRGVVVKSLDELRLEEPLFADEVQKARVALVEALTELDEGVVEEFLAKNEDYLAVSPESIAAGIRRSLLDHSQTLTPVFAGASFRNIGVQPLLDAVNTYLPSPLEAPDSEISLGSATTTLTALFDGSLPQLFSPISQSKPKSHASKNAPSTTHLHALALAFKVVTDPKRGVLVYIRVYSGSLPRGALLYNTNLALYEKAPRLLRMYASDAIEIQAINEGEIGVIVGLKHARTGDTLLVYAGATPKSPPPAPLDSIQLRPIDVPPPLFFTSVEPNSLSEERHLTESLALLLREDPSLAVTVDAESGQTHLAGMGELHLEIARDRLLNDFKVKARTGAIQISYREAIAAESAAQTATVDREIAGKSTSASCTATARPRETDSATESTNTETQTTFSLPDANTLLITHPTHTTPTGTPTNPLTPSLPTHLPLPTILQALRTGALTALARGPTHAFPVHSTAITIPFDPAANLTPSTTPAALSTAARLAIRAALLNAAAQQPPHIFEPVMRASIAVDERALGAVVHDISSARGGTVTSLDAEEDEAEAHDASGQVSRLPDARLQRVYAPPDPFGGSGSGGAGGAGSAIAGPMRMRQIRARVPLREMVGYLKHLRSLTGGRGTFVMGVEGFERVGGQRRKALLAELGAGVGSGW